MLQISTQIVYVSLLHSVGGGGLGGWGVGSLLSTNPDKTSHNQPVRKESDGKAAQEKPTSRAFSKAFILKRVH